MGKKTPPAAPDPVQTAAAQTASNKDTAQFNQTLNMIGSSGPNGSVTYQADPSSPGGYKQVTTLSPGQQQLYDQSTATQIGALGIANQQLGRVSDALGQTVTPGQLQYGAPAAGQGITTSVGAGGPLASSYDVQGAKTSYDPGGAIQTSVAPTSQGVQYGYDQGGPIQRQVTGQNTMGAIQQAQNAVYGQATSRLDPQWNQSAEQLQSQLTSQGLNSNDAAWQTAMQNFNNAKTDAYNQANYSAIGAGTALQQQLYGQQLQSGEFANQAQAQQYGQNQSSATFHNAAQGQEYGQNLQSMQAANGAQDQANRQSQEAAQFYNQGAAQNTSQAAGAAAFGNQASDDAYARAIQAGQFSNQAQQQLYGQQQGNAALNNSAQQTAYGQAFNNQTQPINELSALLGLGQVQGPTGISYTPSQAQSTNVLQAYQNAFQDQSQNYQTQMAQQNAMIGGLASLGGAAIGKWSDARLKEDVQPVGRLDSGLTVYRYRYRGSPQVEIGVLAQEAARTHPHAVHRDPSGFLKVDYGALS